MRIASQQVVGQPDSAEQVAHLRPHLAGCSETVQEQRLGHRLPHLHARIQGTEGILEDHLQLRAQAAHLAAAQAGELDAAKTHRARRRRLEAERDPAQGRLAAAALADKAKRLPTPHLQRDSVDGTHLLGFEGAGLDGVMLHHVDNREHDRIRREHRNVGGRRPLSHLPLPLDGARRGCGKRPAGQVPSGRAAAETPSRR